MCLQKSLRLLDISIVSKVFIKSETYTRWNSAKWYSRGGFPAESPNQLETSHQFHELVRSCWRSHAPQCPREEPAYVALIKEEERQKQTLTMLRVGWDGNHNNAEYFRFFEVTYFGNVFQPQKLNA